MKSLMSLYRVLLDELGSMTSTCTLRDWETISQRVEDEGLSFLTITLPQFCNDFQSSLDMGFVDPGAFTSFKRRRGLRLPEFLRGFTGQVFDSESGVLLNMPNPDAIRAVRQLTLFYSKLEIPCSDARNRKAIRAYVECEKKVRETNEQLGDIHLRRFARIFGLLFGDVCSSADEGIYNLTAAVRPKHGPGATADKLIGNAKWLNNTWTRRLERVLPAGEMLLPNWKYSYMLDDIDLLEPDQERPVKVILVPKTLKTPRIIAIEPTAMQYSQQAVATMLVDEIGLSPVSPMIGFDNQDPNREMAARGSMTRNLATLDLSSASDLVSNQLVLAAFGRWPHLSAAIQASRSLRADVPGYGVMPLAKFASMGSALTFPIEAMVFLTVTIMGCVEASRIPLGDVKRDDLLRYRHSVRVFGDDIVCPTDSVQEVISQLELFGFEVAKHKSFWTGSFRESCGKEYYDGHDVSVVKCRQVLPSSLRDAKQCVSTVDLRNHLYFSGLWSTAEALDTLMFRVFKGHYPKVAPTSPVKGRHSFLSYETDGRLHDEYQSPLVKGFVPHAPTPENSLLEHGERALLKCLLMNRQLESEESEPGRPSWQDHLDPDPRSPEHLTHSGRAQSSSFRLKLGWRSPF